MEAYSAQRTAHSAQRTRRCCEISEVIMKASQEIKQINFVKIALQFTKRCTERKVFNLEAFCTRSHCDTLNKCSRYYGTKYITKVYTIYSSSRNYTSLFRVNLVDFVLKYLSTSMENRREVVNVKLHIEIALDIMKYQN